MAYAVQECIANAPLQTPEEVEGALWAITQCSCNNLDEPLDFIFDAYTKLSDQRPDSAHVSDRERALFDLGGQRIASELPLTAVPALLRQWRNRTDLQRELDHFFFRIDDPRTISHVIRNRGSRIREDERAGRDSWGYSFFANEWRLDFGYRRRMSQQTRGVLSGIWNNSLEEPEDRTLAFILWRAQASFADITILRAAQQDAVLGDRLFLARVSLGDRTSFPDFLRRVESISPQATFGWWSSARGHMDEQLAAGLDACMARHDLKMDGDPGAIFSELIMELEQPLAETILVKYWAHVRDIPLFFQAALFVNTDTTRGLAADTFARSTDKQKLFEHLHIHLGFSTSGRSQRVTLAHAEALVPYLDYLSEQELRFLWHDCNRRRWFAWRRRHVDHRIASSTNAPRIDVASREELLDRSADRTMIWPHSVERDFFEVGYSVDQAFLIIGDWAAKRGTQDALRVAADLFIESAFRSHLPLFDKLVADKPEHQRLRDSVYFAVQYRTAI